MSEQCDARRRRKMAFTVHDEGRQKSTEDTGAPNAKPPPALAAASAPVPAGAPKAERARAPEKEEPLPKANPVLAPALALAPKAGAGAAPNAPAPDAVPVDPGDNAEGAADGKLTCETSADVPVLLVSVSAPA